MFKRGERFLKDFLPHTSAPKPSGFGAHFQARKKRDQFLAAQAGATLLCTRPGKTALFQTFGATPQAAAVTEQNLEAIAKSVGEHEPMARERILLQHRLRQGKEPVETAAQIHQLDRYEHARRRREIHHAGMRSSSRALGAS